MHYVICPACGTKIELPPDAVGQDRTDLFNVTQCPECRLAFDYDDEAVIADDQPPSQTV